jgi:hypothetical protein
MAGGKGKLRQEDNPKPFTKENQPKNRRKPDTISYYLQQELQGDGYAVLEGELMDENGNRTGKTVKVRVKMITHQIVARRLLSNAASGKERSIEMVMDRIEGKVPQNLNLGGQPGTTVDAVIRTPDNPLYQGPNADNDE